MSVHLEIDDDCMPRSGLFVIAWFGYDEEGDVEGDLFLGDVLDGNDDFTKEHNLASQAAAAAVEPERRASDRFLWKTQAGAKKALKAANGAIRAYRAEKKNPELPEWAKTAIANGWKAPKGWKL